MASSFAPIAEYARGATTIPSMATKSAQVTVGIIRNRREFVRATAEFVRATAEFVRATAEFVRALLRCGIRDHVPD
jgi:hypothetical protein